MNAPRFTSIDQVPVSRKLAYSLTLMVLGLGYLFGMVHVYNSHAMRDGEPGLSATDLVIAYSGTQEDTRLEAALKGPMSGMLHPEDTAAIIQWVRLGADEAGYEETVAPIVQEHCVACHGGSNPHQRDLMSYSTLMSVVNLDYGMELSTLVRVSHIHMFGMVFIFFIVSEIFSRTAWRRNWIKWTVITIPFLAIVTDIGSWYLTKLAPGFAWLIMFSGAMMAICFAIQWAVSLYQMWLRKPGGESIEVR
jgi:hypothetical protein